MSKETTKISSLQEISFMAMKLSIRDVLHIIKENPSCIFSFKNLFKTKIMFSSISEI